MHPESPDHQRKIFDQANIPEVWLKDEGDRMIITTALELARRGDDPRHCALAEHVLEIYRQPPKVFSADRLDKFTCCADQGMTEQLTALFAWDNPNSCLAEHRQKLGYEKPADEVPFNTVVVRPREYPQSADKRPDYNEVRKFWLGFTGSKTFFTARDRLGNAHTPTIFVPPFEADQILHPNTKYGPDFGIFIHEYYHTQRHFSYAGDRLYHWLDEVAVDWEPMTGYTHERCALALLARTTPDIDLWDDLAPPFFANDTKAKAQLLRKFKTHFGATGQLLLATAPIRGNYQPDFDLPLITVDGPLNESTRLLETMLELRQRTDPTWLATFEKKLRTVSLFALEGQKGMALVPYTNIDSAIGEATLVGQVMAVWKRVCHDKAQAGEPSFFDKPKQ